MMIQNESVALEGDSFLLRKAKDYYEITKFTVSFTVAFSSIIGYLLVPGVEAGIWKVLLLFVGGLSISGAAIAVNQMIERKSDALMSRTKNRPLPSGRMSLTEAIIFASILLVGGALVIGFYFNWLAAGISVISFVLYSFVYTPCKKINSTAFIIGAIPGALPPLIGWVAGTAIIGYEAVVLFALQFLWQFPHFWAIGWVAYDDYKKAGIRLLPSPGGKNKISALYIVIYTFMLIPIGFLPYLVQISGIISAVIILIMNGYFLFRAVDLFRHRDIPHAKKLMYSSYFYFVIVQLALLADKV